LIWGGRTRFGESEAMKGVPGISGPGSGYNLYEVTAMYEIFEATSDRDFKEARALFMEYAAELRVDLCFQNFTGELENLRDTYGPPAGCLLLARGSEGFVGCVALRPFREGTCEMKRLYLQPAARGSGTGRGLAVEIIGRARARGYRRMVLDTLESLQAARTLYGSLGFREVPPYYDNPLDGVVYMELQLS
jgi:putative acetyltransferase